METLLNLLTNMDTTDERYSAKKPTLFVELHNFSFRRDLFQTNAEDFIGRKHIRNRLKAILNHTRIYSGTYLITGNRGVGKTSLVNKVLNELSAKNELSPGIVRFLTLFFCVLISTGLMKIFNLYDLMLSNSIKYTIFISLLLASLSSYIYHYSSYKLKNHRITHWLIILFRELILWNKKSNRAGKFYQFIKISFCTIVTQSVYILSHKTNHEFSNLFSPPVLCLLFGIYLWIANFINKIHNIFSKGDNYDNVRYRALIFNSKSTSYAIASFITTSILFLIGVINLIVFNKLNTSDMLFYKELTYIIFTTNTLLIIFSIFWLKARIHKTNKKAKEITGSKSKEDIIWCKEREKYCIENKKETHPNRLRQLITVCRDLTKNIIGESIAIKNWINRPRQVFVKINLGYEELKSIDVLRLISHNITIEYRRYIYSGSFFWLRIILITIICWGCTLFYSKFVSYDFRLLYQDKKIEISEINQITLNGIYIFLHNIYDQIYLGISIILSFLIELFNYKMIDYKNLSLISTPDNPYFTFEQFLFFLFLILLYKLTIYLPVLKHHIRAPYSNLRNLKHLQESIVANIKTEDGIKTESKLSNILNWGYNRRIEKEYPMLDAHDIEKKLIDIMTDISKGWLFQSPQFIIIFDELDKIESDEVKKERMSKTDSFSPDTIRLRQEAIFELLSGLKYILSTMPAKFIFVAGREMYEASLADASDRSHYLSSIFDDVINVPSFMSDYSDDKSYDICSMTEQYLCRHLLPTGYIVTEYSLQEYGRYLKIIDKEFVERKIEKDKRNSELEHRAYKREELLMHLNNFVQYLTYAGKGAPKKMISLMDKFVVKLQPYELEEVSLRAKRGLTLSPLVIQNYSNSIYFLKLDFYEQYTIGLMARMIMPVMYRFSHRNIHQYGDKLLVSTLFFMDHLYKFHSHSFSWRAMASSPELIDVNKTPELRNHIADILHFLTQNDLKTISNGLYDFRFFKVIAQEITFMTRVSEISSATFDFSLDESLAVKQYYERRLANQRKSYEADHIKTENSIFELANQHFTLGELYLYDEDLDNAIVEFDAAISIIQTLEPQKMSPEMIIALIKDMLSLGIAYEKQNLNDQAFLVYSEVVKLIVASRNTDIKELGLRTFAGKGNKMKVEQIQDDKEKNIEEPRIYFDKKLLNNENKENSLMELLDSIPHLHPVIHMVISKITTYDGLQLLYLPLLAKFQILEKSQIGGIQKEDIRRLLKEFYFLVNMVNKGNKSLVCASFYLKLGNILYYKNARLMQKTEQFEKNILPFRVNCDCSLDRKNCSFYKGKNECKYSNRNIFWGMEINTDAFRFYIHSLFLIVETTNYEVCYSMQHFINRLNKLKKNEFKDWDDIRLNMLGKVLSCIGDIFMAELETDNDEPISLKGKHLQLFMTKYFDQKEKPKNKKQSTIDFLNTFINKNKNEEIKEVLKTKIVKTAILYLLSALFYRKATAYNMAGYLDMKLLTLLKYYTTGEYPMKKEGLKLLQKSIRSTSSAFKDICFEHQQDIDDMLKDTRGDSSEKDSNIPKSEDNDLKDYNKHSLLYTETFESILAYYGILVASINIDKPDEYETEIISLYKKIFGTAQYDLYSSIYNRIKLLKFKSEVNYRWLRAIIYKNKILYKDNNKNIKHFNVVESYYQSGLKELISSLCDKKENNINSEIVNDILKMSKTDKDNIFFLVRDSLFNLNEILKFVQIYGETFILTNLFVADTHDKMMCWLRFKKWMDENNILDNESLLRQNRLIGERYCETSQECWNWANAARFYYKAEETHHEGRSYKDMINRACFLNDEFSDQRMHFITAQERKKTNEKDYKNKVRNIKNSNAEEYYEEFKLKHTDKNKK